MVKIFIYMCQTHEDDNIVCGYNNTLQAIQYFEINPNKIHNNNIYEIHTCQTFPCNMWYLKKGYKIYVYMLNTELVEIKLGENQNTTRFIRDGHNLEKLLLSNEFGMAVE